MCLSLMALQVDSFSKRGLSVACVTGGGEDTSMMKGVHAGEYQLVFITPELLLDSKRWRSMLTGDTYSNRLRGFVVDEAHCIAKWYVMLSGLCPGFFEWWPKFILPCPLYKTMGCPFE